ncbi:MAG: GAF domain-containing protein, partial [Deltaproteobacteria bacterium]|nr:GAF domain-containing protein [Deltaproteobacteria bacterium]
MDVTARLERLLDRTDRLHRVTARLSTALHKSEVAEIVVDEGATALGAISGGLWRFDSVAQRLLLVRATNFPPEAIASVESVPLDPEIPIADAALRREPVWLSSRADYEARYGASASRTREMTKPPNFAVAALPLLLRDQLLGVLSLTFSGDHVFDDDERSYLAFLALHCAQAFERVRLYAAAQVGRERATFLARASALLGSSLDYEDTLRNVAALAVP